MDSSKNSRELLGVVFVLGGICVWVLISVLGAKPKSVNIGPVEFEIPTASSQLTSIPQSVSANTPKSNALRSLTWQLNPVLPQPQGFTGWISTEPPRDSGSGIWTQDVNVSANENQLLLIFGGLARLSTIGEIGTKTSCFVIASRGPLDLSLDLMSARLEVHNVDATATALEWAAQKAMLMQESYPSTCGEGLDVVIGK